MWVSDGMHIGAIRRIRLNGPCTATAAMQPYNDPLIGTFYTAIKNVALNTCPIRPVGSGSISSRDSKRVA